MPYHRTTTLVALSVLALAPMALGGPLTPPSGPVAPTMKTLTEVEPRLAVNQTNTPGASDASPCLYRITQPGSYYLTGNLGSALNKTTIEIDADNVTLDLAGFQIADALAASGTPRHAVRVYSGRTNVTVRNGTIRGFSGYGVLSQATSGHFEGLQISNCGSDGLSNQGRAVVTKCSVSHCGQNGIIIGGGVVSDCDCSSNAFYGFYLTDGVTLTHCTASDNTLAGFRLMDAVATACTATGNNTYGFEAARTTIADCTSMDNAVYAIRSTGSCTIRNNTCRINAFPNIYLSGGFNRVEGNTVINGTIGIYAPDGSWNNIIIANTCINPSTQGVQADATLNMIGPVYSNYGTITTANPWANFSR